jgi:hypothetical protein
MKRAAGAVSTYLDFGLTQAGRRTSYDYYEGQQAYDLFMGARYLHDLIAYREGNVDAVYHPEDLRDTLRKYVGLTVCAEESSHLTYFEIGSSVFGVIDALNHLDTRYRQLDTTRVRWVGVDNSTFMNRMALYTHDSYDLTLTETVRPTPCDLFFAKGVSLLYALSDEAMFCEVLANSRLAIFDYTFSQGPKIHETVGTGLPVTFLRLNEWRQQLVMQGKTLRLAPYTLKTYHETPAKVTYECVYGDEEIVARYEEALQRRVELFEQTWQRPLLRRPAAHV